MESVMTGPSPGRKSRQYKDTTGRSPARGKDPQHTSTPVKKFGSTSASSPRGNYSYKCNHAPLTIINSAASSMSCRVPRVTLSRGGAHSSVPQSPIRDSPPSSQVIPMPTTSANGVANKTNGVANKSSLSYSAPSNRRPAGPTADLSHVRHNLNASLAACEAIATDSQDDKLMNASFSNTSLAYLKQPREFENKTIQKQRQELELLIGELRDRDRELNDMVLAHQKQMKAWEVDRQKILALEETNAKLQRDLQLRNDDMRALVAKLRIAENEDQNKATALNSTQEQLSYITEQQSHTSLHLQDLESKNQHMAKSVQDMTNAVGQMEAREEELLSVLKLKDRDLSESASHSAELSAKAKKLDAQLRELREADAGNRRTVSEWKNKYLDTSREADHLKRQLSHCEQRADQSDIDVQKLRQDIGTLKKEVILANEREKRKDQLLDLQRSKQERTDAELTSVRHLFERQQRDISLLHLNLESTKDVINKEQKSFTNSRSPSRSPDRELTGQKSISISHNASSPTRAYSPSRGRSFNRAYSPSKVDSTHASIRAYETSYRSPTRTRDYHSKSYSPSRLRSSYSPGRDTGRTYSPSRERTYSPTRERTYSPSRGYSPSRTYHSGTRSSSVLDSGKVESSYTTRSYSSRALGSTGYTSPSRGGGSSSAQDTGAVLTSNNTGTANVTSKRDLANGDQAADSSRHSTPVSSASLHSVGSKGSRSSNQAAPNGELDNSLEELTMSRDDQASAHNSPEADQSLDSQRSASTLHESLSSAPQSIPEDLDNAENDDIDEIFKTTKRMLQQNYLQKYRGGRQKDSEGFTTEEIKERSTTPPVQEDSPEQAEGSQTQKTQLVMVSSVRETDSPTTKLHKLLTESRDMVQELEKSAHVNTTNDQEELDISASEALATPSDTDAD